MSENLVQIQDIHDVVKERYGGIAAGRSNSCCGPDSDCGSSNSQLYDSTLLTGLPTEVTGISLGCGDPVTIAGLKPGEVVLDLGSGGGIDCFLAARQVGETGYVIGVDMTPEMLMRANQNKVRMGPEMRADAAKWAECVTGAVDVEEYTGLMREAGFAKIEVVDKSSAEGIVEGREGMPRLFSARITAWKPGPVTLETIPVMSANNTEAACCGGGCCS